MIHTLLQRINRWLEDFLAEARPDSDDLEDLWWRSIK